MYNPKNILAGDGVIHQGGGIHEKNLIADLYTKMGVIHQALQYGN